MSAHFCASNLSQRQVEWRRLHGNCWLIFGGGIEETKTFAEFCLPLAFSIFLSRRLREDGMYASQRFWNEDVDAILHENYLSRLVTRACNCQLYDTGRRIMSTTIYIIYFLFQTNPSPPTFVLSCGGQMSLPAKDWDLKIIICPNRYLNANRNPGSDQRLADNQNPEKKGDICRERLQETEWWLLGRKSFQEDRWIRYINAKWVVG